MSNSEPEADSEPKFSIRCRGIYSTALTKFLLDNNFKVTQSSDLVRERLSLNVFPEDPDLSIQNTWNRQGILCWGKQEAIDEFINILKENFLDVIIRKSISGKDTILKGKVIGVNKFNQSTMVDFGNFKGIIENKIFPIGKFLMTKVQHPNIGRRKAILSTNITIPGITAILIQNSPNKISKKIFDQNIRHDLMELAYSLKPRYWGILWRTNAADIIQENENILIEEIDRLTETSNLILKKFRELESPGVVYEGTPTFNAEFPSITKSQLDNIRSEIENISTIPYHHYYKIFGENFSFLINFAEELIHKIPQNKDKIIQETQNYFKQFFPNENDLVKIYHVKIDGRIFFLSPGHVISFDKNNGIIKLRRELGGRGKSYYNGIGAIKEAGDYAILDCHFGDWFIKTEYFSKNHQSKGNYWNINTPIELYINPFRLQYVDLEIDLVKRVDGEIQILDEEKLDRVFEENYLSKKLKDIAFEKLYELKKTVENN
ncbi:MAG: ribonuclease E/G [Candidatus Helarchaeota archaeon]|nr:ribonuclease E/G [Candidatus Helarchaeota archaeon]